MGSNILRTTTLCYPVSTGLNQPITKTKPIFSTLLGAPQSHPTSLKIHLDVFPSKLVTPFISAAPFGGSSIQHTNHGFRGGIVAVAALALLPSLNKDSLTPKTGMNTCMFPVSVGKPRAISVAATDKRVDNNVKRSAQKRKTPDQSVSDEDEEESIHEPQPKKQILFENLFHVAVTPVVAQNQNPDSLSSLTLLSNNNVEDDHGTASSFTKPLTINNSERSPARETVQEMLNNGDLTIHVEMKEGEYVLKLRNSKEMKRAEQLAHSAAILLTQAEMLRNLGEKLLSRFQESFHSSLNKSH